ncbi:GNAT family N-acetyltransferase [Microlunatus ginsengisoli]|uniref:Amikacin resistance N-acetyltransferase Eis2 n=1 Tax=Microlunatus ginsengisoli TaxID=363863 RepID=A0ABP6ZXX4_9ACTN
MPTALPTPPHLAELELTYATPDRLHEFMAAVARGFHGEWDPKLWGPHAAVIEPERCFGFAVDGRWVSTCGAYSRQLSVPGGVVPTAAVTIVTVQPSYRRRGLLTAMMTHQLEQIAARGVEPVALLWASETLIYGRYGYGHAAPRAKLTGQTRSTGFLPSVLPGEGSVGELERAEAIPAMKRLHARMLPGRPGALDRSEGWWEIGLYDPEQWRGGWKGYRFALHYGAKGAPDGYVVFRVKEGMEVTGPTGEVEIVELDAADPGAHAALWRFVLDLDLVRTYRYDLASVGEPLRYLVADQRAVSTQIVDGTFARLVDVRRALAERAYGAEVDLVLGVTDRLLPHNDGPIRLQTSGSGGQVGRARRKPDLTVDVRELGAIYLGGVSLNDLHRAGLVQERRKGAVAAAASAFGWTRPPLTPDHF